MGRKRKKKRENPDNSGREMGSNISAQQESQDALEARANSIQTINTIADTLHSSLDFQTVAESAADAVLNYLQVEAVTIYLMDEEAGLMKRVSSRGVNEETTKSTETLPLNNSLTGYAAANKEIMVCDDLESCDRTYPQARAALLDEGFRSVISIPLLFHDKALGAMNLLFYKPYTLAAYEHETLFSIGKTIGLAIANARYVSKIEEEVTERKEAEKRLRKSQHDLQERTRSLRLINNIANALYSSLDFRKVAERGVNAVVDYLQVDASALFSLDRKEGCLHLLYGRGFSEEALRAAATLPLEGSLTSYVVKLKEIIICEDLSTDDRTFPSVREKLVRDGLKAVILVPLFFHERILGSINLFFYNPLRIAQHQKEILDSIGKTIGLAMANAEYINQIEMEIKIRKEAEAALLKSQTALEARTESLEMINSTADMLHGSLNFQEVIQNAADAITEYLQADIVSIFTLDEQKNALNLLAFRRMKEESVEGGVRLPWQGELLGYVLSRKALIVSEDLTKDARIEAKTRKTLFDQGIKAVIMIPLLFQNKVLGAMSLFFFEPKKLEDHENETLFSIGKTIGLAMANASYVTKIEEEATELKEEVEESKKTKRKGRWRRYDQIYDFLTKRK